jgi:outer membrane protein assembly factor BamB
VWALSEKDGKELWAVRIAPAHSTSWPQSKEGPSATPTVDGDRLYVMGLAGNVVCLHAADGKVVWQRNLKTDFKGRSPMWDFRESPLVDGEKVICTPGGEEITMVALNKLTGETIWKSLVPDRAGGGQTQNRGPGGNRPNAMQSDPVLSTLDKDQNKELSADEIDAAPTALLKLDKNQDGKLSEDEVSPQRGDGGNGGGYLACLDFKTGEVLWNERDSDKRRVTKGSVAFADGRIYYRTEEGPIVLIEPSRKEYLERGRFNQPERTDKPAWAHPVVANGKLYIRDQDTLFCYDVKAK